MLEFKLGCQMNDGFLSFGVEEAANIEIGAVWNTISIFSRQV